MTATTLTASDRTFMKDSIKYLLNNYQTQGKYTQDKYIASGRLSTYYKNQLDELVAKRTELTSALGNKDTASKRIIVKHLRLRAIALSEVQSKKQGALDRAMAVSTKIVALNKKLRRMIKESK